MSMYIVHVFNTTNNSSTSLSIAKVFLILARTYMFKGTCDPTYSIWNVDIAVGIHKDFCDSSVIVDCSQM